MKWERILDLTEVSWFTPHVPSFAMLGVSIAPPGVTTIGILLLGI
jgi:hypothetical protein